MASALILKEVQTTKGMHESATNSYRVPEWPAARAWGVTLRRARLSAVNCLFRGHRVFLPRWLTNKFTQIKTTPGVAPIDAKAPAFSLADFDESFSRNTKHQVRCPLPRRRRRNCLCGLGAPRNSPFSFQPLEAT